MVRLIVFGLIGAVIGLIGLNVLRKFAGDGPVAILWLVIIIAVVVVIARNLATNRATPDAAPAVREAALTFTPDPAKAALYVLRTQFVGKAVGVNVLVDGKPVAQIKSPRFTRILLSPGAHRLTGYCGTAKPSDAHAAEVNAAAGAIIVMRCAVEPQIVSTIVKFTPTTLDQARADLQKTRMTQPDVAEV